MALFDTSQIGGNFLTSPASPSLNGSVPYVKPTEGVLSSGSSSSSLLGSLGSPLLGAGASLVSGLIGSFTSSHQMKKQYQYQLKLMQKQDEYTRNLTRDSALLNAEGFQRAGLSRAAMQQGSFATNNIGSTPSAPSPSQQSQLPLASAVQSLLGSVLDNKIKDAQSKQIDAETKRTEAEASKAEAEKVAVQDANMRENDMQTPRLGILGSQEYMQGLRSGYLGNQLIQESEIRENQKAYQKAQISQQEALNDYQNLLNDVYKSTGKKLSLAQIKVYLAQAAESHNRARWYNEMYNQLKIDNRFRAEFDRLNNKLLDNRADMTRSLKNYYYYQYQMMRPKALVNRSLGNSIEDGGADAFFYGLGSRGSDMVQGLLPFAGMIPTPMPTQPSMPMFGYSPY